MARSKPLILGIGGTLRAGSSSERALTISLIAAESCGAETMMIGGEALALPMFSPAVTARSAQTDRLLNAFRRCDGMIISSPAYHGCLSGLIKNALDYAEHLRSDARVYFDGIPVGCIVCAGGWQAAGATLGTMRSIVHALRGWPTPLGALLNTSQGLFDERGDCLDAAVKRQLDAIGRQVTQFALMQPQKLSLVS